MTPSVFAVDTMGTCLFCLNQNCAPLDRNKIDLTTATALKMLFRYLHIDITRLGNVSSSLLDASTNLAASLCDACFFLVDEFLELFQDFERIRLQLEGCTWKLHEFIGKGTKDEDRVREYRRRVQIHSGDERHVRFVEKLRMETFEKCSTKHGSYSLPKIHFRRDTLNILGHGSEPQLPRTNAMVVDRKLSINLNIDPPPIKFEEDNVKLAAFTNDTTISPTSSLSMTPARNKKLDWTRRHKNVKLGKCFNKKHALIKGMTQKCVYCSRYFFHYPALNAHQHLMHPAQLLSKHLPPGVSDNDVIDAIYNLIRNEKIDHNLIAENNESNQPCPLCGEILAGTTAKLKLHILRRHKDQICQHFHQTRGRKQVRTRTPICSEDEDDHEVLEKVYQQKITTPPRVPPATKRTSNLHLNNRNFPCNLCGNSFLSKKYLHRHKNRAHKPGAFKCDLCAKTFLLDKNLQIHLQIFHLKKPSRNSNAPSNWSCNYCDKVYPVRSNLQYHLHVKHSMQLYVSRIPSHISEHGFEAAVASIVEKIIFPVAVADRAHLKSPCNFCGKRLMCSSTYMRVHIVRYHLEKVIEIAEKEMIPEPELTDNDNLTTLVVPCKSEYPSVIPIQLDEDESGSELEGVQHSFADEDPFGDLI